MKPMPTPMPTTPAPDEPSPNGSRHHLGGGGGGGGGWRGGWTTTTSGWSAMCCAQRPSAICVAFACTPDGLVARKRWYSATAPLQSPARRFAWPSANRNSRRGSIA